MVKGKGKGSGKGKGKGKGKKNASATQPSPSSLPLATQVETSPVNNECKIPHTLLEDVLTDILRTEMHRILTFFGSLLIKEEQLREASEARGFDANYSSGPLEPYLARKAVVEMEFRPILTLLHVTKQFRSVIEKQLLILFPKEFRDRNTDLFASDVRNGIFLNQKKYGKPYPLLKSLCSLRGLAASCMAISIMGMQPMVETATANEVMQKLRKREPACRTPIARVYLAWTKLRVMLHQHLQGFYLFNDPKKYDLDLDELKEPLSKYERRFLDKGLMEVCYIHSQMGLAVPGELFFSAFGFIKDYVEDEDKRDIFFKTIPKNHDLRDRLDTSEDILQGVRGCGVGLMKRLGFDNMYMPSPLGNEILEEMKGSLLEGIHEFVSPIEKFHAIHVTVLSDSGLGFLDEVLKLKEQIFTMAGCEGDYDDFGEDSSESDDGYWFHEPNVWEIPGDDSDWEDYNDEIDIEGGGHISELSD